MDFKPPPSMRFDFAANLAETWRKWEQQFRIYFTAAELDKKNKVTQAAILLHTCGPEGVDIYGTFVFSEGEDKDDIEIILKKFRDYCEPRKNIVYERYKFWSRNQQDSESVDQWATDLKRKASHCEFGSQSNDMIRDKVVFGIQNQGVKERLLREADLTLEKALDICRTSETTKQQISAMQTTKPAEDEVYRIEKSKFQPSRQQHSSASIQCDYCGTKHQPRQCPAYGKTCNRCSKRNHFSSVCKSAPKPIQTLEVQQEPVEKSYFVGSVFVGSIHPRSGDKWKAKLRVENIETTFKLDTGAQANVLPLSLYNRIVSDRIKMEPTNTTLMAFGDNCIVPVGKTNLVCTHANKSKELIFYVTDKSQTAILGQQACEDLNLVRRIYNIDTDLTLECLFNSYKEVFTGIGQYEKGYHIEMYDNVKPVIQPTRKIPFTRLEKLKETLDRLQQQGIIAEVDKPTDWVHNLVIVEKKNKTLRICLDPKPLNEGIKRERYMIPTPRDVQSQLSGKSIFTVLDMRDAFWHVRLSDESSYLCTFNTPWGRKRFLRMPFGISSASEVLQKRNQETFGDIPGVHIIADDIIIAGSDVKEHDQTLLRVIERAKQKNVKFSQDKIQFRVPEVKYMGNIVSREGLKADPEKIHAITKMPTPPNKKALQRLLGMIKYLAQYIPNESSLTAPLRSLLREDSEWMWQHEHDLALERVRQALVNSPTLGFYDVNKPVILQADASIEGLGACLIQCGKPVAYTSRSLTSAEVNYAQIERELLAICYACDKFHQFIYGKEVEVHSDHRPLEAIMKKPLSQVPPRLQRMLIRLQRYTLKVQYVPGKELYIPDTLSRASVALNHEDLKIANELAEDSEVMINTLVTNLAISYERYDMIRQATKTDGILQKLSQIITTGWPSCKSSCAVELKQYWNIKEDIHSSGEVLFYNNRVIIPESMRTETLHALHEGHLGMAKCKSRAREVLYWPGLTADIENMIARCPLCLKHSVTNQKETLHPHDIPCRPWQVVGSDIMTFKGRDYLVVVDYYSKYPELALLEDKTAGSVITHLKSIFARHGIPEKLVGDNMPYASAEVRQFAKNWGISITTFSPEHAQSNGQSERMVQTLKNMLKKSEDPYISLLQYRNTPVEGLSSSPAQLLMSRMLRDKLPSVAELLNPKIVRHARDQLVKRQKIQKSIYDGNAKDLSDLRQGDSVYVQRGKEWQPATVIGRSDQPRSYFVLCGGRQLRRNRRWLRRVIHPKDSIEYDTSTQEGTQNTREVNPEIKSPNEHIEQTLDRSEPPKQRIEEVPPPSSYTTQRGRTIKPPKFLDDYVS